MLGGAPFNVAWGLQGLGQAPVFVSGVGNDEDGREVRSLMAEWGMNSAGLQTDPNHATGKVQVSIEDDEPSYEICEDRAWDFVEDQGFEPDGVLYHGLLSLRGDMNQKTLEAICKRSTARRFFDVNLRPPHDSMELVSHWMKGAHWLKLNLDEFQTLSGESVSFEDCEDTVNQFRKEHDIENVVLTAGSQGARMIGTLGNAVCSPAPKPDSLVDTVGAGDAFSARTIHGILKEEAVDTVVQRASQFASRVCGIRGATTTDSDFYKI